VNAYPLLARNCGKNLLSNIGRRRVALQCIKRLAQASSGNVSANFIENKQSRRYMSNRSLDAATIKILDQNTNSSRPIYDTEIWFKA